MEAITIFVVVICSVMMAALGPAGAVGAYLAGVLLYPQALTLLMGGINLNTGRILVLVLLAKVLFTSGRRGRFQWSWMDAFVLVTYVCSTISFTRSVPASIVLVREGGNFLDTVLPYFAVRLALRSKQDIIVVIKALIVIGLPLAFLGMWDAKTNQNPYDFFSSYYSFGLVGITGGYDELRHGFYRASGSFGNSIVFGLFFSAIAPMALGLLKQKVWSPAILKACFIILIGGALSSMSSAPLSSLIITGGDARLFPPEKVLGSRPRLVPHGADFRRGL